MRRLMVLVLLALGFVALAPAAAYACETPAPPRVKQLANAEAVFSGTVTTVTANPADAGITTLYVVQVDRIYKGDQVTEEVTISSPTKRDRCGLVGVRKGNRYLFVTGRMVKGIYQARSHQGTQAISPEVRADVVGVLGDGTVPGEPEAPAADDNTVTSTRVDDASAPSVVRSVAPGVLLVLVGALVLVLTRLFARPRP